MEDKDSSIKKSAVRKTALKSTLRVVNVIAIILLPIEFLFGVSFIATAASNSGFFYMRAELTLLITLLLFPVTWIYLGMRASRPNAAKKLAQITAALVILLLPISTAMETNGVAPLVKMDNAFTPPSGWVKQTEGNDPRLSPGKGLLPCQELLAEPICPEIRSAWVKDETAPMTLEEFKNLATANGYNDFTANKKCSEVSPSAYHGYYCTLTGKVNGVDVSLSYDSESSTSRLVLDLK